MPTEVNDFLAHFGVKGMRWGVIRERYNADRNRPLMETKDLITANGVKVTLKEDPNPKFTSALAAVNTRFRNYISGAKGFSIYVNGDRVGETAFKEKSKDELNLAWITVEPEFRGKGYATTVFGAGVAYAKSQGYKRLTLEVPGNAPDARHIYEKFGFKETGRSLGADTDDETNVWGGLTEMAYDIPNVRSRRGRN